MDYSAALSSSTFTCMLASGREQDLDSREENSRLSVGREKGGGVPGASLMEREAQGMPLKVGTPGGTALNAVHGLRLVRSHQMNYKLKL